MLREAQAACQESAVTGVPIDEVTGMRAKRRRAVTRRVSGAVQEYNDRMVRATERRGRDDELAKRRAMASLVGVAGGEMSRRRFLARNELGCSPESAWPGRWRCGLPHRRLWVWPQSTRNE